MAALI